MYIKTLLFFSVMLLSACASNQPDLSGPLGNKIRTAAADVKLISGKDIKSCKINSDCRYIGDYFCTSDQVNKNSECENNIKNTTAVSGGDSFIVQIKGLTKGGSALYPDENYYRIHGQIFDCSGKNKQLHSEYKTNNPLPEFAPIKSVSDTFAKQCALLKKCKKFRSFNRSTVSVDPFNRIIMDYGNVRKKFGKGFNFIVIKNDLFNRAGFYRLYTDTYECP